MSARPRCAQCGRRYGRRSVERIHLTWPAGEEPPLYRGNQMFLRTHVIINKPRSEAVEFSARYPNAPKTVTFGCAEAQGWHEIWDGATWLMPYEPFCTLRCALAFARRAYKMATSRLLPQPPRRP